MNIGDIDVGLKLVTAPVADPVALADAKTHLGVSSDFTDDDGYISDLITVARQATETVMRRALLAQTWRLSLRQWPGRDYSNWPTSVTMDVDSYYKYNFIKLPFPPLASVVSVTYLNSDGVINSMAPANNLPNVANSFNVFTDMEPGRIVLPFAGIWPTDILMPGAPIQITFNCGYADLAHLQSGFEGYAPTLRAIKEMLAYSYEYRVPPSEIRRSNIPAGIQLVIEELLSPWRIYD